MGAERIHGKEPAHDVLAAEEFALPAPDPELRQQPLVPPEDPSGIAVPHDVLAAEEFAMPAASGGASRGPAGRGSETSPRSPFGTALLAVIRTRRRRRWPAGPPG